MAANTGFTTIRLRRDTTTNWTTGSKLLEAGEVGLDTTTGKIKFGTSAGQAWASAKDVAVIQSDSATNVNGGAEGSVLYQSASGTTAKLAIGSTGTFLYSNGAVPAWYKPKISDLDTSSSSDLQSILSDETGSGAVVFGTSPSITSATLTTPTIGGAGVTFNGSSSGTAVLRAAAASGTTVLNLPTAASTETLITSETVATNYVAKAGSTMSGTLNMGTNAISNISTLAASGTVTLTGVNGASTGVAKVAANGALTGGNAVSLTADVSGVLPVANGGLGVATGTTVLPTGSTSGLAPARSVLRIFVQSAQPASGNITGYTPAVGDLWFW
jgi:hypothetical protein